MFQTTKQNMNFGLGSKMFQENLWGCVICFHQRWAVPLHIFPPSRKQHRVPILIMECISSEDQTKYWLCPFYDRSKPIFVTIVGDIWMNSWTAINNSLFLVFPYQGFGSTAIGDFLKWGIPKSPRVSILKCANDLDDLGSPLFSETSIWVPRGTWSSKSTSRAAMAHRPLLMSWWFNCCAWRCFHAATKERHIQTSLKIRQTYKTDSNCICW